MEAEKRRAQKLEMKRLEWSVATPGTPQEPRSDQLARAPNLPAFNENTDKMDAYLERFERFAKNNNWQEDVWATRLSALLTGMSLEFYSRISREEADDYGMLKLALPRHYDYTEEGYRRKFRGCNPEEGETPALFIERIKSYLEKWLETAGIIIIIRCQIWNRHWRPCLSKHLCRQTTSKNLNPYFVHLLPSYKDYQEMLFVVSPYRVCLLLYQLKIRIPSLYVYTHVLKIPFASF